MPEEIDPKENRRENIIAIGIVLVVIVAAISWAYIARHPAVSADAPRVDVEAGISPAVGDIDAPVTVIEFSDFECPYCGSFVRDSMPRIERDLIESGQIRLVFKQFPLTQIHPKALRAAQAALCAERQGKFWEYHETLFENQEALEIGDLEGYAERLGLNTTEFHRCFINEETLDQVKSEIQQGIDAGVKGTPTFFFNGRPVAGALSPDAFEAEVEKELVPR